MTASQQQIIVINQRHQGGVMGNRNWSKRGKPFDPAEAARKRAEAAGQARATERARKNDPARWGANAAAMDLPANADVGVEAETRTKVARISRFDVFALLFQRGSLEKSELDAVRRLQGDIAVRFRVDGGGKGDVFVDSSGSSDLVSARSIDASDRIHFTLQMTGALSTKILLALTEPQVAEGRQVNWRAAVERETGEKHPVGQVSLVRCACANLASAYTQYDKLPKKPQRRAA